ncbi:hypothetical protein [Stenotrophomonas rhizophila]|uniref:hypothetical protein n=1 Tax=Stenotrophomonas rhizophila TaxID=216778 RepID=UPI0010BF80E5|nr:hypothetical protein [Stenotrophomonas rhizophila]TKK07253.1 hypothetical protein SrhCFBP13529_10665 [Stenotrophomonas rhizophila]
MSLSSSRHTPRSQAAARLASTPDPQVLRGVRQAALAGLALVLVWPAARGSSEWLGWLPLWLVGMPWLAWWSLYRFRLPTALLRRRGTGRRRGPQARRRARVVRPDLRHGSAGRAV